MKGVYRFYLLLSVMLLIVVLFCSKDKAKIEKVTVEEEKGGQEIGATSLPDIDRKYDRELIEFSKKTLRNLISKTGYTKLSIDNPYRRLSYGVFVTLKEENELRGCIGQIFPTTTVEDGVRNMTINAALNDPRFKPVSADEINKIKIEISILYNMHKIKSIDEFVLKRDGIVIRYSDSIGVLLPQVAEEGDWTKERFFEIASMKAGLGSDGWRRLPVEFFAFNCKIINEEG